MDKKTQNEKVAKLKEQYKKLKRELKASGYDIEDPNQFTVFEKLKMNDIIKDVNGSVLEFIESYSNKIEEYRKEATSVAQNISNTQKESQIVTEQVIKKTKNFKKIIKKLNNEIIDTLPEREKPYEEMSHFFDEERTTFEKTYGKYTNYSKIIQNDLDRINQQAKKSTSFKDLGNLSKNLETMRKIIGERFNKTAEQTNLLKQIDKEKEVIDKEVHRKSSKFQRSLDFLKKNKITITSLAAGITANNPLVMWAVEAYGSMKEKERNEQLKQAQFKYNKLNEIKRVYQQQDKQQIPSEKKISKKRSIRESVGESYSSLIESAILKELKAHTQLLKQMNSGQRLNLDFQKESSEKNARQLDQMQAANEEAAMEANINKERQQKSWRLTPKNRTSKEKESSGLLDFAKEFGEDFLFYSLLKGRGGKRGIGILGGLLNSLKKFATGGLIKKIFAPIGAITGAIGIGGDLLKSNKNAGKYGTGRIAAAGSGAILPITGALLGSIIPVIGPLVGFAAGSILKELLPNNIQMEIAGVLQDAINGIRIFWNQSKLALAWVGGIFADLGAALDKMKLRIKMIVLNTKAYINKALGHEIFNEKELDKNRNIAIQEAHARAVKRHQARRERDNNIEKLHRDTRLILEERKNSINKIPQANQQEKLRIAQETVAAMNPADPRMAMVLTNLKKQQQTSITSANVAPIQHIKTISNNAKNNLINDNVNKLPKIITQPIQRKPVDIIDNSTLTTRQKMQISDRGLDFIKSKEGFRSKPYWDVNGWAIGYGSHTMPDGTPVTKDDIISKAEADNMLRRDIDTKYTSSIRNNIKRDLTQSQFDALASISYNAGPGALGEKSSLTRTINEGNMAAAAEKIKTHYATVGGQPNQALNQRRMEESNLFSSATPSRQYANNIQANSQYKLNANTPASAAPVVVNNINQRGRHSQIAGDAGVGRAAPRGNEPALQAALNTDFSGSTA